MDATELLLLSVGYADNLASLPTFVHNVQKLYTVEIDKQVEVGERQVLSLCM